MKIKRMREYRKDKETRDKFADVKIYKDDFIHPYFVVEGAGIRKEIPSLKDVYHFSVDNLLLEIEKTVKLGINKILLFGVVSDDKKDAIGIYGFSADNIVSVAIREIKKRFPEITLIADVCLCGWTTSAHCGIVKDGLIQNDISLEYLSKIALSYATLR